MKGGIKKELRVRDLMVMSQRMADVSLTRVQKQYRTLLRELANPVKCPWCKATISYLMIMQVNLEAKWTEMVDLLSDNTLVMRCIYCKQEIEYVVPIQRQGTAAYRFDKVETEEEEVGQSN